MSGDAKLTMLDGKTTWSACVSTAWNDQLAFCVNGFRIASIGVDGVLRLHKGARAARIRACEDGLPVIGGEPMFKIPSPKNPNTVDVARALGFNTWASREITDEEARDLLALIPAHIKQEGGSK